jgi:NAD(P)H-flavin reductase
MRDDDPRSLNDDFVRTFTVSSPPGSPPNPVRKLKDDEFEITVRRVGAVTEELFKHQGSEQGDRMNLEVGVKGFGGEFDVKQDDGEDVVAFVAAGVGITPLLPCLDTLDLRRLELVWTVRKEDVGLVEDVLRACPGLAGCLSLFVTNATDGEALDLTAGADKVDIQRRRLAKQDLDLDGRVRKYYLCTGTPMRKQLMAWLPDKELLFEDFNF